MGAITLGYGNDLARRVREDHSLTQDNVGRAADLAESSICRAELGERELTARHLRALYALTHDLRVIQYICPGLSIEQEGCSRSPIATTSVRTPPAGNPLGSNEKLLAAIELLAAAAKYNAKTLADGVIDDADHDMIANEQKHLNDVSAIIAEHQRNLAAWIDEHERLRSKTQ